MNKRSTPLKPDGDSPFATFCQWIWDVLAGGKFPFGNTKDANGVQFTWENGVWYGKTKVQSTPAAPASDNFIGEIDLTGATAYTPGQWGVISAGDDAGAFICTQATTALANPPTNPSAGNQFWVCFAGPTQPRFM